ncbi:uncharacterized protein LOC116305127 isoform X2 [Actinia tenebrosa]|uniref:Uncharacterized protein LOC116305127 isoform X2 n=1 Tax=Actinia tenebrosa TaxID=6105 RepID=A0A6P8IV49_ACTTE|nr:uncharacterized protein LOC116305127 isoform X2 [Actinia tenebrosa]
MTFMYHMYGINMGTVMVYIKINGTLRPVWIKSRNQFNRWRKTTVYLDEKQKFQVVIEGIVGTSKNNAAIDEMTFTKGQCQLISVRWVHVYYKMETSHSSFKIHTSISFVYDDWTYDFSFTAKQTQTSPDEVLYFIYPEPVCTKEVASNKFSTADLKCIPIEFFYGSKRKAVGQSKILLMRRSDRLPSDGIALEGDKKCCQEAIKGFFYAKTTKFRSSACLPGWHFVAPSCIRLITTKLDWVYSNDACRRRGGKLATPKTTNEFMNYFHNYFKPLVFMGVDILYQRFFVGVEATDGHRWLWINNKETAKDFRLNNESKSSIGKCGVLLKDHSRNEWTLKAVSCNSKLSSYLCMKSASQSLQCEKGWIRANTACFRFEISKVHRTWYEARQICRHKNGLLAVLSSKSIIRSLGASLDFFVTGKQVSKDIKMFVGLKYVPDFRWTEDKEPVLNSMWFPGQPDLFKLPKSSCGAIKFTRFGWRLVQVNCGEPSGLICQQDERNLAYQRPVRTNASASFGRPTLATDGSYATCFATTKGSQPWLEVDLRKPFFIKKVIITNRRDCCFQDNELGVTLGRRGSTSQLCPMRTNVFLSKSTIFVCSQQLKVRYVTIQALKLDNLTLCEVMVTATERKQDFKGVFQEVWHHVSSYSVDKLRLDDRFPSQPEKIARIKDFDAPVYNLIYYGQSLTTYLQVPVSGEYVFYAACNDACELWIDNATESTLNEGQSLTFHSSKAKILDLYYKNFVGHNVWDRYPDKQTSLPIFLSKCNLYKLEMLMKQDSSTDCASAGMRLPNGTFERPIPMKRLFYVRPGYRNISFNFIGYDGNRIITVASNRLIDVKASYEYCCLGVYCPVCPVKVYLQLDDKVFLVNETLSMNCNTSHIFEFKLSLLKRPKSYPIKIRFSFVDEENSREQDLTVGELVIYAKTKFECNYIKDTCSWKNGNIAMHNQWNFTKGNEGYYLSASEFHTSAWLESAWIPNDEVTNVLGWCLSFYFLLPSTSQLQVILKTPSNHNGSAIWSLSGFQSKNWSIAQISWKSKESIKLNFLGKSMAVHGLGVGIDSLSLVASSCPRLPIHSEPGYKCKNDTEFQCANGQCINKELVCDGDAFCSDGSDETNCKCFSHQFSCSNGECIEASQLCNGNEDCVDGSDESRCNEDRCDASSFQCVSGSCVPWSQTCDGDYQCDDETDEPEICGSSSCPINNMSCSALDNVTFGVECDNSNAHCDFEKGLCSLSHDPEGEFQWQIRSGSTPTQRTGPNFDHTTLNQTGKYVYIEASDKNPGKRALLLSDYLEGEEPVCIRFWYHMKGIHIGTLNIYSKRNSSRQLLWTRSGNKGDKWLYGQIGYNSTETFKILFEGTIGRGSRGDIALDDLTIAYDNCTTLDHEGQYVVCLNFIVQLFCNFDEHTCGWRNSPGWTMSRFGNRPVSHDWQQKLGGYLYLSSSGIGSWETLTSPIISTNDNIACITLWFYIYTGRKLGSEIRLSIKSKNKVKRLWINSTDTHWQYSQIPLTSNSDFQLIIEGRKTTERSLVLLDDITLSKESCDRIPKAELHHPASSLNAEKYWKLDGTDKDLRSFGFMVYKEDGGRMAACFDGKTTHLETPAIDFHARSFSITCWVKVEDPNLMSHIYSDWSHPFQFRLYAYKGFLIVVLRGRSNNAAIINLVYLHIRIPSGEWTFTGFSWNRQTKRAVLFRDQYSKQKTVDKNIKNINLRVTNHTFYEIGFKKDSGQRFRGCLRDLTVFGYAISVGEMLFRYMPSSTLCPIRQTLSGECCFFPFIFNGKLYHHCFKGKYGTWCSLTPNYDRDRKWGYCQVDAECRTVDDGWCGWQTVANISTPWKQVKDHDMRKTKTEIDNMFNSTNWSHTTNNRTNDYEVHFPKNHADYINITNIPDMTSFTICMWLRTNDTSPGTPFIYRVRYEEVGKHVLAIGLVDYTGITVFVGEHRSGKTNWKLNLGIWIHVCLRWISNDGTMHFNRENDYSRGIVYAKGEKIPGKGELIVGVTSSYARFVGEGVGQFVGDISDFNYWNWFLSNEDVNLRSVGCGLKTIPPHISWELLKSFFVGGPLVKQPATCKDSRHPRVLLNLLNTNGEYSTSTTFLSPLFPSSFTQYGLCLRFAYLIYSHVNQELLVFQHLKVDNFAARLVWAVNESGETNVWGYARASIAGVSSYKLSFQATTGNLPGYIAIKGIQVMNGYCTSKPAESHKVNSQRFTSPTGYVQSPFFPGYYGPSSTYRWHITVESQSIIRLYFVSFILEDHPECTKDYVSVYSMDLNTRIGKYCGIRHPNFVDSTGNVMIVVFKSDSNVERQGFKLLYNSRPARKRRKETCISYKGCPVGCHCSLMSSNNKWLVIKSQDTSILSAIPSDIPKETKLLLLANNRIYRIMNDFTSSARNLEYIDLSNNIITHMQESALEQLKSLKVVRMNKNFLRSLPSEAFPSTNQLSTLDLSSNLLTTIEPTFLRPLTSLRVLSLRSNKITFLNERVFEKNSNLTTLYLNFNQIEKIPELLFSHLQQLKILYLNDNKIKTFTSKMFSKLTSIEKLYLQHNYPLHLSPEIFSRLQNLKELHVDGFFLCCYAKKAIPNVKCISPKDFFSSCSDLMKNKTLQIFIWILGLSALLGNVFVVILRSIIKEDNKVHSFLLTNLAIADFLMGVYLLIIAIKDVEFQGEYFRHDSTWRTGNICKFAGGLSLLSSEVSVLFLTFITADRLKNIVFPFRSRKLNLKSARLIAAAIWIVGIVLSVIPMANLSYFYDEKRRVGYYGRSALCLPLQLSRDKLAGWEYSVAIFIVLNLISFVFIAVAYIIIFITVQKSSRSIRSTSIKRESQMAKRMAFIIATDFFCWMPVIIIGILSLLDLFHDPEQQVYAWLAVFVLPVNSSINPILYTFSTPIYKEIIKKNSAFFGSSKTPSTKSGEGTSSTQMKVKTSLQGPTSSNKTGFKKRSNTESRKKKQEPNTSEYATERNFKTHSSRKKKDKTELLTFSNVTIDDAEPDKIKEGMPFGSSCDPEAIFKVVEVPKILLEETNETTGFLVVCTKEQHCLQLMKYMHADEYSNWMKEARIASLFAKTNSKNVIKYCWHAKGEQVKLVIEENTEHVEAASLFISYEYISSVTLEDLLKDNTRSMSFYSLCAIINDLLNALKELHQHSIVHGSIFPGNILIKEYENDPPLQAFLCGFSKARIADQNNKNIHLGENIQQFGAIFETLMKQYWIVNDEINRIIEMCSEHGVITRPTEIKDIIMDTLNYQEHHITSL